MAHVPNIVWLRQFNVIAEEGSVLAAARRLNISQPALSKNLRALEADIGAPLFSRHARGLTLTEFGTILLEKSKRIEAEYAYALSEISNLMSGNRSLVRIGAGPFWETAIMPAVIAEFHRRLPGSQVQLITGLMDDLIGYVEDGRLDIAVGSVAQVDRGIGLMRETIAEIDFAILASRTHPLAKLGRPAMAADFAGFPFVGYQHNTWLMSVLANFFAAAECPPPSVLVETTSLIVGMELVRAGDYLVLESRPLLHAPIGRGLVAIETAVPIYTFPTGIIRQRHATLSHSLRVFRSILVDVFHHVAREASPIQQAPAHTL